MSLPSRLAAAGSLSPSGVLIGPAGEAAPAHRRHHFDKGPTLTTDAFYAKKKMG